MKINCLYDELVSPKALKPHPKNRNKHPKDQIDRLAKLIEYQGVRAPVVVSKLSGYIVKGHGTVMALSKLKLKEIPVVYQEFKDEDQEYAFCQSDNAIANWAELDLSGINLDIENLGPDFDIDMLGLKDFAIDPNDKYKKEIEDEVPATPKEPISKLGDLYELGEHRLLCGDSTDKATVERLMNGQKADMVFTDPPYGISCDTKSGDAFSKQKSFDDSKSFDISKLNLESDYVIWGGNYYDWLPEKRTEIGWIVWDKRPTRDTWDQETRDAADRIFGQHFEIAVTNTKGLRGKMLRLTWGGYYGTVGKPDEQIVHKTQKPTGLLDMCANKDHKVILDYFGGSGSTLIACEKTKRKCFMSELDPHYVQVIIERWMKYTGKMAYLIGDANGKLKNGPVAFADLISMRSKTPTKESKNIVRKNAGPKEENTEINNA